MELVVLGVVFWVLGRKIFMDLLLKGGVFLVLEKIGFRSLRFKFRVLSIIVCEFLVIENGLYCLKESV